MTSSIDISSEKNTPSAGSISNKNSSNNSRSNPTEEKISEVGIKSIISRNGSASHRTGGSTTNQQLGSLTSTPSNVMIEENEITPDDSISQQGGNYSEASKLLGEEKPTLVESFSKYSPSGFTIPLVVSAAIGVSSACANGFSASGCNPFDNHTSTDKVLAGVGVLGTVASLVGIFHHRVFSENGNQNVVVKVSCAVLKTIGEVSLSLMLSGAISGAAVEYRNS